MRTGLPPFLAVAVALVVPASLHGQRMDPVALGGGYSLAVSGPTSGHGFHARFSTLVTHGSERLYLRGTAFYQSGRTSGSPLACEQVRQFDCLGREDETRIVGASISGVVEGSSRSGVRAYFAPVGVGLYWQSTRSREGEGPTGVCVDPERPGDLSCPGAPPLRTYTKESSGFGPGVSTGLGLQLPVRGARLFAELGAFVVWTRDGETGGIPFTVGVMF